MEQDGGPEVCHSSHLLSTLVSLWKMHNLGISIESLPQEILLEIINYVSSGSVKTSKKIDLNCVAIATKVLLPDSSRKKENFKSIGLVSRRFSDMACPILLSRVVLGGFTQLLRHKTSQLKELSKGDNKASALAKHLSIDYSSSFPNDPAKVLTPLEKAMFKHLKPAIRSFKAITTVS